MRAAHIRLSCLRSRAEPRNCRVSASACVRSHETPAFCLSARGRNLETPAFCPSACVRSLETPAFCLSARVRSLETPAFCPSACVRSLETPAFCPSVCVRSLETPAFCPSVCVRSLETPPVRRSYIERCFIRVFLVSNLLQTGLFPVAFSGCLCSADSVDCTGCSLCSGLPAGASAHCGRSR